MTSDNDQCFYLGFLHLNLQSLYKKDKEALMMRINILKKLLETEHEVLHCPIKNLIAIMLAQLPHRVNEAKKMLEKCKSDHPNNINTVCHLKNVCKKFFQTKRSNFFRSLDEEIRKYKQNEMNRSVCFLEQGFVLLLEEMVDQKGVVLRKLEEIFEIFNHNDTNENDELALNHCRQAQETLRSGMISIKANKKKMHKMCVDKLSLGISLMSQSNKNISNQDQDFIVWKYYLAIAHLNQEESLQNFATAHLNQEQSPQNMQNIIKEFTEVIAAITPSHSEVLQTYKGRAIAFLVEYMYMLRRSRKKWLEIANWIHKELFTFANDSVRNILLSPVDIGLTIARECAPNDEIRKVCHGKCLWYKSKMEVRTHKLNTLMEAETILNGDFSISTFYVHKICTSTRSKCRMDIAFLQTTKEKKIHWLKMAYSDAVDSCHNGDDTEDLFILASVCKSLAIEHSHKENGMECNDISRDYFYEAVSHYTHLMCFEGSFQMKALKGMGKSYAYLQKYKKASECMFHAMLLSSEVELIKEKEHSNTGNRLTVMTSQVDSGINDSVQSSESTSQQSSSSNDYISGDKVSPLIPKQQNDKKQTSTTKCLKNCCSYLIQYYQQMFGDTSHKSILIKLRDTIVIGKLQGANIEYVLEYLCKSYHKEMTDLLLYRLFSFQIHQHHTIACICITFLMQLDTIGRFVKDSIMELELEYKNNKPSEMSNLSLKCKFQSPEWQYQPGPKRYLKDNSFIFDFFVSYSSKDSEWVKCFLVDRLEQKFDDTEIHLKGCFADRDFIPGKTILDNIIHAIYKSSTVIFVLTKGFIESHWCKYELEQSLVDSLNRRRNCIIPVLKDDCNIPKTLSTITYLDLTDPKKYMPNIVKLKKRIVSKE